MGECCGDTCTGRTTGGKDGAAAAGTLYPLLGSLFGIAGGPAGAAAGAAGGAWSRSDYARDKRSLILLQGLERAYKLDEEVELVTGQEGFRRSCSETVRPFQHRFGLSTRIENTYKNTCEFSRSSSPSHHPASTLRVTVITSPTANVKSSITNNKKI